MLWQQKNKKNLVIRKPRLKYLIEAFLLLLNLSTTLKIEFFCPIHFLELHQFVYQQPARF